MILAAVSAAELWYWNIGVGWSKGYFGVQTLLLVSLLFCIVYIAFAKTYHAFSIGDYRLTDLTFSQALSFAFSDGILFVSAFFWFHNFDRLKIHLFLFVYFWQCSISTLLIFVFNRWNVRFDGPRKITIIYGNDGYSRLINKMDSFENRYDLLASIDENDNTDLIRQTIEKSEDVYIFEVNKDNRNEIIRICREMKKQIHVTVDVDDILLHGFGISHFFDIPFYKSGQNVTQWYYPSIKRASDIILSSLFLLLLLPVMIATGIAIKAEDGGPIIYKQTRLTKNGNTFVIYKFRSMKPDSETKAVLAKKGDDRITNVGKVIRYCRIDELPQLLNILKGDMTIVGPRPERPEIAEKYEKDFPDFSLRLEVKAGLTGYAQVYGKYNTTPEDKLKMDLLYITNRSILLDIKILFYTLKIMVKAESTEGVDS